MAHSLPQNPTWSNSLDEVILINWVWSTVRRFSMFVQGYRNHHYGFRDLH